MFWFRLRERLKNEHVEECYKKLLFNEMLTREELLKWQKDHLYMLIRYIAVNNPFYSRYIQEHRIDVLNEDRNIASILSEFPITDKLFIKQHYNQWLSNHLSYDQIPLCSTSGSSGVPFRFFQSGIGGDYKTASKYRLYNRFGVKISDLQLCYGTGYNSDIVSFIQHLKINLNQRLVNKRIFVDVSQNGGILNYQEEINRINRLRIRSVWGYTSTIVEISKYAIDNHLTICNNNLKAIILSGEGHDDRAIEIIKKAFGPRVKIVDEYNSVECFLGGNCHCGKMHLNEDTTIFEVLRHDGTISSVGEGELLVTNLFNYDFPFIRYKNGDIVCISEKKCDCNLPFRIVESIEGRSACVIYNGNNIISHATCTHLIPHSEYKDKVLKFQFVQNMIDQVIVKIVPIDQGIDFSGLEELLRSFFSNIKVHIEFVNDIPKEKSGKYKDVINNVK